MDLMIYGRAAGGGFKAVCIRGSGREIFTRARAHIQTIDVRFFHRFFPLVSLSIITFLFISVRLSSSVLLSLH